MHNNHTKNIDENQGNEILKDYTKSGKVRPWREKKVGNVTYAELLEVLKIKKAENVRHCGYVLEFKATDEGYLKLYKTWFCKSKLCPVCNWRRSMKNSYQTQLIVKEVIKEKPSARWLFMTLSNRNSIDGETLDASLKELTQAFNRLMKYKKVNKNLIGFMRTTEITVNKKNGSYNQHMHVLLCVESKFFRGAENYITQKEWLEMWKKALKVSYEPVLNIKAIKPNAKGDKAIESAIKETAKYSVKASDYLSNDEEKNLEVVADLEQGLYKKRMISYGGLLKIKHKELNLDNTEDGDLVQTGEEKNSYEDEKANSIIAIWNFEKQNYFLVEE